MIKGAVGARFFAPICGDVFLTVPIAFHQLLNANTCGCVKT
jgi:hypothetical protein